MVHFYPALTEDHIDFIKSQPLFFVASAPLAGRHINLSPKGHPARSFAVLEPNTVAYLDATGSGCETISHVYENGRVTVMFCSFGVSPRIMRLFCTGSVIEWADKDFEELRSGMGSDIELAGARAIIKLDVWEVQTSCGFGVPVVGQDTVGLTNSKNLEHGPQFSGRDTLGNWARKMEEKKALISYQTKSNFKSLDELPGMRSARRARGQWMLLEDIKAWMRRLGRQLDTVLAGMMLLLLLILALHAAGVLSVQANVWSRQH